MVKPHFPRPESRCLHPTVKLQSVGELKDKRVVPYEFNVNLTV
jgi:hypothetical protein